MEIAVNKLLDSKSMATVKLRLYKIIFTMPVMNIFKILLFFFLRYLGGIITVPGDTILRIINLSLSNFIG